MVTNLITDAAIHVVTNHVMLTNLVSTVGAAAAVPTATLIVGLIGFIATLIAIVAGLIKIFGERTSIREETLRSSHVITEINTKIEEKVDDINTKIKDQTTAANKKFDDAIDSQEKSDALYKELRDVVSSLKTEVETLKVLNNQHGKNIDELKAENKELVKKLEDLVRQLWDYLNQTG